MQQDCVDQIAYPHEEFHYLRRKNKEISALSYRHEKKILHFFNSLRYFRPKLVNNAIQLLQRKDFELGHRLIKQGKNSSYVY